MGRPKIDLRSAQFGRLTVLSEAARDLQNRILWRCRCLCGSQTTVYGHDLRSGDTTSCGCFQRKMAATKATVHGHSGGGHLSPTYHSWMCMIQRITNPNATGYSRYGGAGVKIAPEWLTFEGFLKSRGERPAGTTLGRILDMGDYVEGNAFWMTNAEQKLAARNKRALVQWTAQQPQSPPLAVAA
jgi:hypothetical protein